MRVVDRVVLLVAWVMTCGLVYLLGFYVGKGTQERRLGVEERLVRLPVTSTPPPEGQRPKSENEFVFYDKLMGEHAAGAHEQSRPVAADPHPAPAAPAAPAGGRARPVPAATSVAAAGAARPATTSTAAPPARTARAEGAERPSPSSGAHPGGSGWTVLANPTRSRDEADGLTRQLRGRGYDATLVRVLRDGDTWYRVQVGRFGSPEQASEVMHRLREHEGISHAFVASE